MILAKRAMKQSSREALQDAISENKCLISIFPDTIMIHHSTDTIHIRELYFTYDEFLDMIQESTARFTIRRKSLDTIIKQRLSERLKNLPS